MNTKKDIPVNNITLVVGLRTLEITDCTQFSWFIYIYWDMFRDEILSFSYMFLLTVLYCYKLTPIDPLVIDLHPV